MTPLERQAQQTLGCAEYVRTDPTRPPISQAAAPSLPTLKLCDLFARLLQPKEQQEYLLMCLDLLRRAAEARWPTASAAAAQDAPQLRQGAKRPSSRLPPPPRHHYSARRATCHAAQRLLCAVVYESVRGHSSAGSFLLK